MWLRGPAELAGSCPHVELLQRVGLNPHKGKEKKKKSKLKKKQVNPGRLEGIFVLERCVTQYLDSQLLTYCDDNEPLVKKTVFHSFRLFLNIVP